MAGISNVLRGIAARPWFFPFRWGIPVGLLIGAFRSAAVIGRHRYIQYHLYSTASGNLARSVDLLVGAAVVVFFLLLGLYLLEKAVSRGARRLLNAALAIAAAVGIARWVGLSEILHGLSLIGADEHFLEAVRGEIRWELLCIGLGVALLCVILKLLPGRSGGKRIDLRKISTTAVAAARRVSPFMLYPSLVCILGINAAAGILAVRSSRAARNRPDIVLITICSVRRNNMGCYGYGRNTTPAIDGMAAQGMRFDDAIAQASWTNPSVASFMTSRLPQSLGMGLSKTDDSMLTLAEALKENGYATAGIVSNYNAGSAVNMSQGFDIFIDAASEHDISSPSVTASALRTIEELDGKRMFLFLLYADPHDPYIEHEGYTFRGDPDGRAAVPPSYDSEMRFTDHHIGLVLGALKTNGLYDNALVILVGDHGEAFGEHGRTQHGNSLYQELIQIPLIIKLPRQETATSVSGTFPLTSIFPSIMRHVDLDISGHEPVGRSVEFRGLKHCPKQTVFSATLFPPSNDNLRSVQEGRYKLIIDLRDGKEELYDLADDPLEKHNVVSKHPDLVARLRGKIMKLEKEAGVPGPETILPSRELERLRSLGYIE